MDTLELLDGIEGDRIKHMRLLGYPAAQTAIRLHLDSKAIRKAYTKLNQLDGEEKTTARRAMIWRGYNVIYAQALDLAYNPAYLFDRGRVVMAPRFNKDGNMQLDEEGNPVLYPVLDRTAQINGMKLLLQVLKQMADFDGLSAPSKISVTDPDGKSAGSGGVHFYMPFNGRDNALPNPG